MRNKVHPLRQLLFFTVLPRGKIIFATLCSVLNKICDIVPEILIGISIDVIVQQEHSVVAKLVGITSPYHQLYAVGALTALLWILESVFEYLYAITWRSIAQSIQHDLRLQAYATVLNADLAYFEGTTTGGLLHVLQDDINQLEQFLSQGPNDIIQLVVNVVVMGLIFLYVSPMLALLVLLPIPFVVGIAYYFQYKMAALYEQVRSASAAVASHIAYRLQGITTIKSYITQRYELALLDKKNDQYRQANLQANKIYSLYVPVVRMAIMVGFILSLVVGGIYALQGKIPLNWYAALVFLTQRFLWPFTALTTITDMYERAVACAQRIVTVLGAARTIQGGKQQLPVTAAVGAVAFKNVSFSYAQGHPIFDNFSVNIPAGKTVAFVGATGSGKSTIIKLLLRFYDAQQGVVSLDGHDITTLALDDLRACIGLVSQEVYLVEGTIADNIAYGTLGASPQAIQDAARMAQAHSFIMGLPDGYATVVQEQGKNLSGGQRQRISIARAVLKKAPILVFDEATAALDNETEAAMQESMAKLAQGHTLIIIAHRLSTVRNADTIVVLDHGVVVEQGSHSELLKKNGAYARLWQLQVQ